MSRHGPNIFSTVESEGNPIFTVTFPGGRQSLGLDLDIEDKEKVQVCRVCSGPIESYNRRVAREKRLEKFDYIVEVNGTQKNSRAMLQILSSENELKFSVARPFTFPIEVDKAEGELGLWCVYAPAGNSLLIRGVKEGIVREYNNRAKANRSMQVQENDRIVEVNGVRANDTVGPLLEQLKQQTRLKIVFARLGPSPDQLGERNFSRDYTPAMPTADPPRAMPAAIPPSAMPTADFPRAMPTADPPRAMPTAIAPSAIPMAESPRAKPTESPRVMPTAESPRAKPTADSPRSTSTPAPPAAMPTPIHPAEEQANGKANDADAQFDENVAKLVAMGFTHDQATDALIKTGGNLEEALDLPSEEPAHEKANDADAQFDDSVAQLVAMGFTHDQATEALSKTGGNIEEALALATEEEPAHGKSNEVDTQLNENVAQLEAMGFTKDQATDALNKTGGNLDAALGVLIG